MKSEVVDQAMLEEAWRINEQFDTLTAYFEGKGFDEVEFCSIERLGPDVPIDIISQAWKSVAHPIIEEVAVV
jgi:hypothetical protein